MFKSVRLYFVVAFVTRTNFDICRCWTILGIARRIFYVIWLTQDKLYQGNSIDLHHYALSILTQSLQVAEKTVL